MRARRLGVAVLALAAPALAGCAREAEPAARPVATVAAARATTPTVAHDPGTGLTYVAWVGRDGDEANVYLAVSGDGGASFSAPVRVNDVPGDAAPHEQAPAQVAVGPEGPVYVLWQNNTPVEGRRFPASDLRFARSTDGGRTFAPAVTVNDDAGGTPSSHTFHDLVLGTDGAVYVSWIDSRVRDSLSAAPPGSPGAPGGHAAHGDGAPGPEIRVARSTDGGRSFGPSAVVDGGACPCCRTSLAVAPDGTLYLAWRKVYEGDVRDVVVSRASPGGLDFSEPVRVHADGWVFPGCPHAGPAVAVDAGGRVHVAWYTGEETRQGLWHAVSADGGRSFNAARPLLTGEWVPPLHASLAAGGGAVWAAWEDERSGGDRVLLGRLGGGASFEALAEAPGAAPDVARAGDGAVAVWLDDGAVRALRLGG